MGVFNVERRVASSFVCPTPASAAPANRANRTLRDADLKTPHCEVEVVISTCGVFVDRISVGCYSGHLPDAAVMLQDTAVYAEGKAATGFSARRLASMLAACVLGAAIGVVAVSIGAGCLIIGNAALPTVFAAVTLHGFLLAAAPAAVIAGVAGACLDNAQWATAHRQFDALDSMDRMAARYRKDELLPDDERWTRSMYRRHVLGPDWVLSQAAMELESARVDHEAARAKQAA